MKGSSCTTGLRIRVLTVFALTFISAAVLVFGLTSAAGTALGVPTLPLELRISVAVVSLIVLALVDVVGIRKRRYCLLGWRRQTPKTLGRRYSVTKVAAVWGFDAGLIVTTFRVGAITWGALALTGLGFTSWWTGLAYGVAFTIPLLILILKQPSGDSSTAQTSVGPRLEQLLTKRPIVQLASAIALLAGAVFLLRFFSTTRAFL
ncbi:MAG: hypothetical protein AABN95_08650 [Acidobacteriota bacterium]